jgi:hypothetical protein
MRTLALLLAATLLPASAIAQQRSLTWSAGQPTGGWYEQATGMAKLVQSKDARFDIKPAAGAAFGNMTKVQQGETQLAWSLPPVIAAAYNGEEPFKGPQSDLRVVMTGLGYVHTQFVVAANAPLRSLKDVFAPGAKVRMGAPRPGGSDDWELRKIFAFYNTSYPDYEARGGKLVVGSFKDMVEQFRDGKLDVFMLNNAVPAGDVEEAARAKKTRLLPMDKDLLEHLERFGIVGTTVKKGSYKVVANNDADIPTAAMSNAIVASAKLPEDTVYDFTRILLSNLDALRKIHPAFADFDPKEATRLANVPLHAGAARAYREAGLLK